MVRITVDNELLAKLGNLRTPATLQDTSGRVLAYLTLVEDPSDYVEFEPEISEEELARREAKGGGKTLPEIWEDFERKFENGVE
jgi:hypothetical protein